MKITQDLHVIYGILRFAHLKIFWGTLVLHETLVEKHWFKYFKASRVGLGGRGAGQFQQISHRWGRGSKNCQKIVTYHLSGFLFDIFQVICESMSSRRLEFSISFGFANTIELPELSRPLTHDGMMRDCTRCQYHQHFTHKFFVQKCFFFSYKAKM